MTMETKIRIAARLYEARDTVRCLLGDKYASQMAEGGKLLSSVAAKRGENVLKVATQLASACEKQDRPFAAVAILAAAVELLEPSGSA